MKITDVRTIPLRGATHDTGWPGGTDPSGRFTLRTVRCLGLCASSPAMRIDGQNFARVDLDKLSDILEQFK